LGCWQKVPVQLQEHTARGRVVLVLVAITSYIMRITVTVIIMKNTEKRLSGYVQSKTHTDRISINM